MAAPTLFRPIQYMGSKLNLAEKIADHICPRHSNGTILDPFSGTGVMGQEFAKRGCKVVTSDALDFCNIMSRATLGIGKRPNNQLVQEWKTVQRAAEAIEYPPKWNVLLSEEKKLIGSGDGEKLLTIEGNYPRRTTEFPESMKEGAGNIWRLTEVFAGTYLGLKQCLDLDRFRWALEQHANNISSWCYDSILTALMSSASNASYSAGKHFAQFHNLQKGATSFHKKRLIKDRTLDIKDFSTKCLELIINAAEASGSGHQQFKGPMEGLKNKSLRCDWIYADPPYTAQQYSRFYHLLESFVSIDPIRLMHQKNKPTKGLIPPKEDRHQSNFSKKTTISGAFQDLIELSNRCKANLAISYSTPRDKNSRMISLDGLHALLENTFEVEEITFNHKYREFNKTELSAKSDSEDILLVCRRKD